MPREAEMDCCAFHNNLAPLCPGFLAQAAAWTLQGLVGDYSDEDRLDQS